MLGVWEVNTVPLVSEAYSGRKTELKELYLMYVAENIHAHLITQLRLRFWTLRGCFNTMSLLRALGRNECILHMEEMQIIYG